jgi:hypothetical protein
MSIGEALAGRTRSERRRGRATRAPSWADLRPAEKVRVNVYGLLLALVTAFVAVVGLLAGLGA